MTAHNQKANVNKTDRRFRVTFSKEFECLLRGRRPALDDHHRIEFKASIKNVIESRGVPHTEIGQILADRQPVGFGYIPTDGCQVSVRPMPVPVDVTGPSLLRPEPFDRLRFIVDVNVGKLAPLLRILGIDTAYSPELGDREIADKSASEQRVVLSRDVELLKYGRVRFGRLVRGVQPDAQLKEIVDLFGISAPYKLFSRCLRCNRVLVPVAKGHIQNRLEPKTKRYYHRFKKCPDCRRIYWQGSHHEHMLGRLKRVGINVST